MLNRRLDISDLLDGFQVSDNRVSQIASGLLKSVAAYRYRQVLGGPAPNSFFFGKSAKNRNLHALPNLILLAKEFVK